MNCSLLSTLPPHAGRWLVLLGLLGTAPAWAQVDTYRFTPSTTTYTPLAAATATALDAIEADEAVSAAQPIGFPFIFDGTTYSTFRVSSNGFVSFAASPTSTFTNTLTGAPATLRPLIAPFWEDLNGNESTAAAAYQLSGTAPNLVLTIEWLNWKRYTATTGPSMSFQVKLYQTSNRIELVYRQEAGTPPALTASIGLAGIGTGSGSFLSLSDASANPTASSTTSTDDISARPATGQVYGFVPSRCTKPTAPVASNATNTSVTLAWTDGAPATTGTFELEYGPQGFILGTGTVVRSITTTTYQLTGLNGGTDYCVYLSKNCGTADGSSPIVGPTCFRTLLTPPANDEPCGAITLGSTSITGSNVGATTSTQNGVVDNLPACSPSQVPKDVWYAFTASSTSEDFTITGTSIGMLRVFSSPDCAAGPFVPMGCQAASGSNVGFRGVVNIPGLTVGQRYYVAVSGYGSTDPNGSFSILAAAGMLATKVQAETNALLVYPNPSNTGQLTLRLSIQAAASEATLLNALGQTVLTRTVAAGKAEQMLDTHDLAAGLYTLRVRTGSQVLTRKVVLE